MGAENLYFFYIHRIKKKLCNEKFTKKLDFFRKCKFFLETIQLKKKYDSSRQKNDEVIKNWPDFEFDELKKQN